MAQMRTFLKPFLSSVRQNIPSGFGVPRIKILPHSTKYVVTVKYFTKIKFLLGMIRLKYTHQRYSTVRESRWIFVTVKAKRLHKQTLVFQLVEFPHAPVPDYVKDKARLNHFLSSSLAFCQNHSASSYLSSNLS